MSSRKNISWLDKNRPDRGRIGLADVAETGTPEGASMLNDELRKLALQVDDALAELQPKGGDGGEQVQPGTTTTGGDTKPPVPPVQKKFVTQHNDLTIVPDTDTMNFLDSNSVRFVVTQNPAKRANVQAFVEFPPPPRFSTWVQGECTFGSDPVLYSLVQADNQGLRFKHSCLDPANVPADKALLDYTFQLNTVTVNGKRYTDIKLKIQNQNYVRGWANDESLKTGQTQNQTRGFVFKDTASVQFTIEPRIEDNDRFRYVVITATATDTNTTYVGENTATTGKVLYKETVSGTPNHKHIFKRIREGAGITINEFDDYIEIIATGGGGGGGNTAINRGTAATGRAEVYYQLNGTVFEFKRIRQGDNITVTQDNDYVYIASPTWVATGNNLGGGTHAFYENYNLSGNTYTLNFNTFNNAHDFFVTKTGNVYTFNVNIQGTNVGTGAGVFKDKIITPNTNSTLRFKRINAGTGISIDDSIITADTITISCTVTDTDSQYAGNNVGGYSQVFKDTTGTYPNYTHNFRTLTASGNGLFTQYTNHITFEDYLTGNNLGTAGDGEAVWVNKSGTPPNMYLNFRRIAGGSNVAVSVSGNSVVVSATGYAMANVGTGTGQVWRDTTGTTTRTFNLKTIKAGANISVTNNADDITIAATINVYNVANLGSGHGIWRDTTGTNPFTHNLKSLVAGAGISISSNTTEITIASTAKNYFVANVGGGSQVYKDFTDSGSNRTFNLRTITSVDNTVTIVQGTDAIDLSVTNNGSVESLVEGTENNYNSVSNTMLRLIFKHAWNVTSGSGFNADTFDHTWNVTESPATGDTLVRFNVTNPLYVQRENSAGITIASTSFGTRSIVFKDNDSIEWDVYGATDPEGYRRAYVRATAINGYYTADNVGDGDGLSYKNRTGSGTLADPYKFNFRRIKELAYIDVATTGDNVTIEGWQVIGENIGECISAATPYSWYAGRADDATNKRQKLFFKKFQVSGDLSITNCTDAYIFSVNITGSNVGGGSQVLKGKTGSNFEFRTLVAGDGISIEEGADEITFSLSNTAIKVYEQGVLKSSRKKLDFRNGTYMAAAVTDDTGNGEADITFNEVDAEQIRLTSDGVLQLAPTDFRLLNLVAGENLSITGLSTTTRPSGKKDVAFTVESKHNGFKYDTPRYHDGGNEFTEGTWTADVWYTINYIQELISDVRTEYTATSNLRRFSPDYKGVYHIVASLAFVGRDPASNAVPAVPIHPELAIFRNGVFESYLAMDKRAHEFARLREVLILASVIAGGDVDNEYQSNDIWLHGSNIVEVKVNDTIEIRARVRSANRYVSLQYGQFGVAYIAQEGNHIATATQTNLLTY